jgi:hypothetical protein
MLNPWLLLALVIGWGASVAGAGFWAYGAGQNKCEAEAARDEHVAQVASAAAAASAAEAISKIEIKTTTIRQATERIVRENTVFRDCRSGPDAVRLLNSLPAVAASGAVSADRGELPASGAAR